jgi:hypothetical protein
MATLDDLQDVLKSIDTTMTEQKTLLVNMLTAQATRDRLSSVNTSTINPANAGSGAAPSIGQNVMSSAAGGIGAGIGAAGGLIGAAAGIAGFMAALSLGSMGLDWLGADYTGIGDAFASFSEAMENLSPAAMIALGGVAALAASTADFKNLYGLGTASGMTGIGAGISGFLIGLSLGEIGLSWIGNDYSNLGGALASFSDAIGNLSTDAVTLFAGVAGIAIANQAFKGDAVDLIAGMGGVAGGIAAFLSGLVLADIGLDWITGVSGADGSGLKSAFKLFNDSVGELKDTNSIIALGAILAAGTTAGISSKGGIGAGVGIAAVMTGIGAGIAGLMIGLTAGNAGIEWINNISGATGDGLVSAFKMFNDSVGALNNENAIIALGTILGVGTTIGAISGATGVGSLFVAGGIGLVMAGIGAGIAGLFIGLAAGGKIVDLIESIPGGDGDGLVSVFKMFNNSVLAITPEAIERLKDLTTLAGMDLKGALFDLSAGVVAMFATEGIASIGGIITEGFKNTVDFIFGTNYADQKNPSIFQGLVDGLEPIKGFDVAPVNTFIETLDSLTAAFERLSGIDAGGGAQANIFKMMKNIGGVLGIMPFLLRGGYYRGEDFGYGDNINFGPEGAGGLLALRDEDLELLKTQVSKLYGALDMSGTVNQGTAAATVETFGVTSVAGTNGEFNYEEYRRMNDKKIEIELEIFRKKTEIVAEAAISRIGAGGFVNYNANTYGGPVSIKQSKSDVSVQPKTFGELNTRYNTPSGVQ